ncbi:hypothetical protein XCCB100_0760 [Xanthomonas campestris pv. campestris]|uniref:Uncharacterized protein n=1 Tax=Xanthomonas campestris pv. campestris (strain B100) TaxID=509169 RepID=B0RNR4_XANCB|nr:hypothetical protein XCCB100_0760 [Xanthomonas campestris pv. campestris]
MNASGSAAPVHDIAEWAYHKCSARENGARTSPADRRYSRCSTPCYQPPQTCPDERSSASTRGAYPQARV